MIDKNRLPLISVVVPVYNVEKYLIRCLNSIIHQTYKNIEIILIDDGSTDSSGKICDKYGEFDHRIRVIHKENGGLSDARNFGLNVMCGEYVTCIDSDDFVSSFYIENLWNAIKKSEATISMSWFIKYYDGDTVPCPQKLSCDNLQVLGREQLYERLLYQNGVEVSAWGKLYKADLFKGVRYPVGKLYEDVPTTYKLIEKSDKIAVIPNIDYYYFQRENSIAQGEFSLKKFDAINHMNSFKNFIVTNYPTLKSAAECRYFSTVCNILFQINSVEYEKQKQQLWDEIKYYRHSVLMNKNGRKKARFAAALSYFGYNVMYFMYKRTQG